MDSDFYRAYDADVTRRLEHSETRIKNWVMGGIAANILALLGLGTPLVYYLGTLSSQATMAVATQTSMATKLDLIEKKQASTETDLRTMEAWASQQGYAPLRKFP